MSARRPELAAAERRGETPDSIDTAEGTTGGMISSGRRARRAGGPGRLPRHYGPTESWRQSQIARRACGVIGATALQIICGEIFLIALASLSSPR